MCKTNLFLRIFTFLIVSIAILFLNNYYLFILLFFYMLLLSVIDTNYKSLLLDFAILIILLFCKYNLAVKIIVKTLSIINMLYITLRSFSNSEKKYMVYALNKKERKKIFYRNNLNKIIDYNKNRAVLIYGNDIVLNNKVNRDMNRLYLYSKVRFFNYSDKIKFSITKNFTIYDLLFSTGLLILIITFHIYW